MHTPTTASGMLSEAWPSRLLCRFYLMCHVFCSAIVNACPVAFDPNSTSYCECNILNEIHCYNLDAIPEFVRDDVEYRGIYMSGQDIQELRQGVFQGVHVKKIMLNFNPIQDRISGRAFDGLESDLQEIHIAGCGIRSLPHGLLSGFKKLRVLHLWDNNIRNIPKEFFRSCKKLQQLILWGNKLQELREDMFVGLNRLRKLDLDKNRITSINSSIFQHLQHLESLYLGENNINVISANTFQTLSNLRLLHLDRNGLRYLFEGTFSGLWKVVTLNMQDNNLDDIAIVNARLTDMPNLASLQLKNNDLTSIYKVGKLHHLQQLDISENSFDKLSDHLFRECPHLTHLIMDDNRVDILKPCSLPPWEDDGGRPAFKTLSLVRNPISCDCRMAWVQDLAARGVSVLGTCHNTEKVLAAITDPKNYQNCSPQGVQCPSRHRH